MCHGYAASVPTASVSAATTASAAHVAAVAEGGIYAVVQKGDYIYGSGRGTCDTVSSSVWLIVELVALLPAAVYFFWNFCYRQGKTGQSIGKSVMKFVVISEKTWQPIGFWMSLVRQIAHYIDQLLCYVGYLFPLWDAKRQTIADKIMSTVCVPFYPQRTQ